MTVCDVGCSGSGKKSKGQVKSKRYTQKYRKNWEKKSCFQGCHSSGKLFVLMRVRLSLVENPSDSSIVPIAFFLPLGLGFILSEVMLFLDGIKVTSIGMFSLHLCQFYTLVGPDLSIPKYIQMATFEFEFAFTCHGRNP